MQAKKELTQLKGLRIFIWYSKNHLDEMIICFVDDLLLGEVLNIFTSISFKSFKNNFNIGSENTDFFYIPWVEYETKH